MNTAEKFSELFENSEIIPLEKGAELALARNAGTESFGVLAHMLEKSGFSLAAENNDGGNEFAEYAKNGEKACISYTPFEKTLRMICEKDCAHVNERADYSQIAAQLLTQVRTPYFENDCGMSYVIRLSDGRFIVIDGGAGEYDEAERTMRLICSQNVLEKPTVAAWFITHAHLDHFGVFAQTAKKYAKSGELKIERLFYSWSVPERTVPPSPLGEFDEALRLLEDTEIITPRSGQKYVFADAEIDILFCCEDLYPEFIRTLNDTSLVFRMNFAGRRIMWLGDIMGQGSDYIVKKYPKESLECEILQVGHHGYWGGSQKLYEAVNPETLLWPCPDFWYCEVRDWDCNRFLKNSEKIKNIFVSGREETVIDMTKPVEKSEPYKKSGAVLLEKTFGKSVCSLGMSCITGGNTGYRPFVYEYDGGKAILSAGNARSVLELVQPGFAAQAECAELALSGEVFGEYGEISLVFSNPHPTVWNETKSLKLAPKGKFDYCLVISRKDGKAVLYESGKLLKRILFCPAQQPCGIYFSAVNAKVSLEKTAFSELGAERKAEISAVL